MTFHSTLGASLLLAGLVTAGSGQPFGVVPSAHAGDQSAQHEEQHDHEGHTKHSHADVDQDDKKHTEHDHGENDHDRGQNESGHEEHAERGNGGADHALHEDSHGHDEDVHAGHDHGEKDDHSHGEQDGRDHGDHAGHGHDDEGPIRLTEEVLQEFGIEVRVAGGDSIAHTVRLPGEVVYNADRMAHVSPTVAGSVRQVNVSVGEHVEVGQIMATLSSRELAAARSDYLAAVARLELARENLTRDRRLLSGKVGTKQAVDVSRKAHREAEVEHKQAVNALYALGFTRQQVVQISQLDDTTFSTYEMRSPLNGIVTQRHITIGEVIEPDRADAPFMVADLSTVWVNLTVYQRDLPLVRAGLPVLIEFGGGIPDARGSIAFLSPALDENTRTATARVVLKNPAGERRPGLFVSGHVAVGKESAAVVVPNSALTEMEDKTVVFVQTEQGFEPREVQRGRATFQSVEITAGLHVGERYAATNVLALKAEANRASLEHAGHVH